MKIYFSKIKDSEPDGVFWSESLLNFGVTHPIVIQPSEIMKVPVNTVIKLQGDVVLSISTHEKLIERVGVLFPPVTTLNSTSSQLPLELAVKNEGRNPLHLMTGQLIAVGYLLPLEKIEPEEFSVSVESKERPKSRPIKRNKDIKFEVK